MGLLPEELVRTLGLLTRERRGPPLEEDGRVCDEALHERFSTFDGCPNAESTRELVQQAARLEAVDAAIEFVDVNTPDVARKLRFLGSPSVRVDGEDVAPSANFRGVYGLMCRTYRIGFLIEPDRLNCFGAFQVKARFRFVKAGGLRTIGGSKGSVTSHRIFPALDARPRIEPLHIFGGA